MHWRREHLEAHIEKLSIAQFVAMDGDKVVGSCSNTQLSEEHYNKLFDWYQLVGGYTFNSFDPDGRVLFGVDISVHPDYRRRGIGRAFYERRKSLIVPPIDFYATTCRIPDFLSSGMQDAREYFSEVKNGKRFDRTLSALLRYDLKCLDVLTNHMDDAESGNAAALLEWRP